MSSEGNVRSLARTLEQELTALLRGASLECIVCGEFVMHAQNGVVFCPECGSQLGDEQSLASCVADHTPGVHFSAQAG
jgi:predicted RNA-binding Zn-ribbon protein involved in translation (DUF1610 family)